MEIFLASLCVNREADLWHNSTPRFLLAYILIHYVNKKFPLLTLLKWMKLFKPFTILNEFLSITIIGGAAAAPPPIYWVLQHQTINTVI